MVCLKKKKKKKHDQKYVFYLARAHSQSHFPPFQGKAVTGSLGLSLTCCLSKMGCKQGKKDRIGWPYLPYNTRANWPGTGYFCYLSGTLAPGKGRQKKGQGWGLS